jgi:hypothetical protein
VLIRGTVVDVANAYVEWAAVWFAAGDHPTTDVAALTDAHGTFTLTAPATGSYRIGCRAEGYEPEEVGIDVGTDDIELTITLSRA